MKNSLIVIGLCFFLMGMPVGFSDCGCMLPDDTSYVEQSIQPWISDADIAKLQERGLQDGWTFTVGETPATERPLSQLCGLVEPDNWRIGASFDPCNYTYELPAHFDWRELGGCTPIKNQGGCGSCWAFGTVAALECNILIRDKTVVDLSEQWLVSCNKNGWGCDGGWWAHSYFQYKPDQFNGTGAVVEEAFPYVAKDASCNGPYSHPYTIDSWHYVGYSQGIVPKTDAIKQAIMTYGPVSVCCAVTEAFGAYSGGIFNEDDPEAGINHAVALVGWDDTQGTNGVWILRNSWGTWWGEDGYMRIEYGVCKVGYAACYVIYPAKTKIEITGRPFGVTIGVKNVWNITTTDIKWNAQLKGGILGGIDNTIQGTIESLEPGTVEFIKIPCFGFGFLSISVTTVPIDAGRQLKHATGFLLGSMFIVSQNQ